jgi:hypothetical protein
MCLAYVIFACAGLQPHSSKTVVEAMVDRADVADVPMSRTEGGMCACILHETKTSGAVPIFPGVVFEVATVLPGRAA